MNKLKVQNHRQERVGNGEERMREGGGARLERRGNRAGPSLNSSRGDKWGSAGVNYHMHQHQRAFLLSLRLGPDCPVSHVSLFNMENLRMFFALQQLKNVPVHRSI